MKRVLETVVRVYRRWVSPTLPPSCRFAPTCSEYALASLESFGAFKGSMLTARRVLKCHPFHPGGYDPVPEATGNIGFRLPPSDRRTGICAQSGLRNPEPGGRRPRDTEDRP